MRSFRPVLAFVLTFAAFALGGSPRLQSQAQLADLPRLMQQMTALTKDGKLAEAADVGRTLAAAAERIAGRDHVLTATTLFALGQVQMLQGKLDKVEATFKLASHWYVESDSTVALVTGSFVELKRAPGIGRAEALRRAMLALIARGGRTAHPSSWAPFVVVGEGS
jgi:hypothetical protein